MTYFSLNALRLVIALFPPGSRNLGQVRENSRTGRASSLSTRLMLAQGRPTRPACSEKASKVRRMLLSRLVPLYYSHPRHFLVFVGSLSSPGVTAVLVI